MALRLNRPLTQTEKSYQLDMLQGNINRISASQDIDEISQMLDFAIHRLKVIAQSRMIELRNKKQILRLYFKKTMTKSVDFWQILFYNIFVNKNKPQEKEEKRIAKEKTVSRTITNTTGKVKIYDPANDSVSAVVLNLGSSVTEGISKKALEKIAQDVVNAMYVSADLKVLKVEELKSDTMKYTITESVFIGHAIKVVPVTAKKEESEEE